MIERELSTAVNDASRRPELLDALTAVYAALSVEIDRRKPICVASGKCCHFEEYGHRLYVSTLELAKFVAERKMAQPAIVQAQARSTKLTVLPGAAGDWDGKGCPFQVGGLCSVHAIRPFGCRIYFCDSTSVQWQHEQYERLHGRLRGLHDALNVPYFYVEWRFALSALGIML